MPSATTGSRTTTLAGAACSPSSASPRTARCAWTCARVPRGAGVPPVAAVWASSISMCATSSGGATVSLGCTWAPRVASPVAGFPPFAARRGAASTGGPPAGGAGPRRTPRACAEPTPPPAWRFVRTYIYWGQTPLQSSYADLPPRTRACGRPTTQNIVSTSRLSAPGKICINADSASATHATARVRVSPAVVRAPASSTSASARASCWTFGRTRVRSSGATPAFTLSAPP
eukprot:6193349-Pleurochrysis_carterae.AAC.1